MTLPGTPEQYHRGIAEKLNWLENLSDKAHSLDERIDVTNLLLIEILKVSAMEKETYPFPLALSTALMQHLVKDRPEYYKFVDIDMSTARTNEPYLESGQYIGVDNLFARGEVTLRLNEDYFDTYDLRRQKYIQGPFTRFFITNVAGQGAIRLFVSRGYQAASEPTEAINRAELAARLDSPMMYDRRGDVMFMDSFEDGINKWITDTAGNGASVNWTATYASRGGFSCELVCGSDGFREAEIERYFSLPVLGKLGFEFTFLKRVNLVEQVELTIHRYTGTTLTEAKIEIDIWNEQLEYQDSDGNMQVFASPIVSESNTHLIVKVVVDFANNVYNRMSFHGTEYDMSAYSMKSSDDEDAPSLFVEIKAIGRPASNGTCYIDNVILTQNEP